MPIDKGKEQTLSCEPLTILLKRKVFWHAYLLRPDPTRERPCARNCACARHIDAQRTMPLL